MITKYFTKVQVKFNPFIASGSRARVFLAHMPITAKLETKVLANGSKEKDEIIVTFKDKHVMTADPATMNSQEMGEYFDRHSKKLAIKEAIEG
ncbi:MRPL44 [[Candida] subhashii]|uniref:Large ribosomal subunit protein mL53 n=1 Tax=[Candida] subhashii TaxID=561895 RepID=A0A8J5UTL7_9ASCO|nr:MRPL44 [[Candida] subhashii]KAG7661190.1 MRPL44 [[Candida] subhashii]